MKTINKQEFEKKIVHETRLFVAYALFLALFFCSLTTYKRLILGEYSISYLHYGYGLIEALILSKVILLGQTFGLGEKFADKPLIYPSLYKAVVFTLFVLVFAILEHFVTGFLHGHDFAKIYQELIDNGIYAILAKIQITFFVLLLFFAFLEMGRVLIGEDKLFNLFFRRSD